MKTKSRFFPEYWSGHLNNGQNSCQFISGIEDGKQRLLGIVDLGCSLMRPFNNPPLKVRSFCDMNTPNDLKNSGPHRITFHSQYILSFNVNEQLMIIVQKMH